VPGAAVQVWLEVSPIAVALPDLDNRVADWITPGIKDPAAQVRHVTHCGRNRVVDNEQVVVSVEREFRRIERPLANAGRALKLGGEGTPRREGRNTAQRDRGQERAPAHPAGTIAAHGKISWGRIVEPIARSRTRFPLNRNFPL